MATAKNDDAKATTTEEEAVEPVQMPPVPPPLQQTLISEPNLNVAPPHVSDSDAIAYGLTQGAEKTFVEPPAAPSTEPTE